MPVRRQCRDPAAVEPDVCEAWTTGCAQFRLVRELQHRESTTRRASNVVELRVWRISRPRTHAPSHDTRASIEPAAQRPLRPTKQGFWRDRVCATEDL